MDIKYYPIHIKFVILRLNIKKNVYILLEGTLIVKRDIMTLFLVSTSYDDEKHQVVLTFYDDVTAKYVLYRDETYLPYCLSPSRKELDVLHPFKISTVDKYDSLNDKHITMYKGEFRTKNEIDALKIYVKKLTSECIPNPLWEYKLTPQMSYIYDEQIEMGMPYEIQGNKLVKVIDKKAETEVDKILGLFQDKSIIRDLIRMFEYGTPKFKKCAIDIEVLSEPKKFPLPEFANFPILCICIVTSDGKKIALVLKQPDKKIENYPNVDELYVFSDETELILKFFELIVQYPTVVTFNGDQFDLRYVKNRAHRLGILSSKIPLYHYGSGVYVKGSTHIDLYKFFKIQAIQNYAFGSKYKNVSLDEVSEALLHKNKIKHKEEVIGDMNYLDLINYCVQDTLLTLELSEFDDDLVMNLIMVISRVSRLPIEECSRKAVGQWIASFLFNLHRRLGYLIPRPEDIKAMKGSTKSNAKIKGKQYEGAKVFDTKQGIHFGAVVIDFSSLYPSIIKLKNIGYSTIRCPHEECHSNTFGNLQHWICIKNKALESLFIGGLRDLRVVHYKQRAKDKTLTVSVAMWYKCVEQVIKVFMNASYGVFSTNPESKNKNSVPDELAERMKGEGFAFLCPPASEMIAGISKMTTLATAEKALSLGLIILGGDTDSLFIVGDRIKIDELRAWAQKEFNIELSLDKVTRFMGFSSRKKNYIMVFPDGTYDAKGLTGKKKHTPKFFKEYYAKILKIICSVQSEKDIPAARKEIKKTVKEGYDRLKQHKWNNISDLAFHITITDPLNSYVKNTPQHVKAARQLEKAGTAFELGTEISYLNTIKTKFSPDGVAPLELCKESMIDVEKYIEKFQSTMIQVLDMFDVDWDKDILGATQLTRFFG